MTGVAIAEPIELFSRFIQRTHPVWKVASHVGIAIKLEQCAQVPRHEVAQRHALGFKHHHG